MKHSNQRVCMSVCLSVHTSQQPHVQISTNSLYVSPVAVAQSSSTGSAICYVLPVLWMTSCLHNTHNGANEPKSSMMLRLVEFARWWLQSYVRQCYVWYNIKRNLAKNSRLQSESQICSFAEVLFKLRKCAG